MVYCVKAKFLLNLLTYFQTQKLEKTETVTFGILKFKPCQTVFIVRNKSFHFSSQKNECKNKNNKQLWQTNVVLFCNFIQEINNSDKRVQVAVLFLGHLDE